MRKSNSTTKSKVSPLDDGAKSKLQKQGSTKWESISLEETPKTYTIDEAIEQCGYGRFQAQVYLAAFLIWWADTAEILVLTFLTTVLTPLWGLSNTQAAAIFSSVFAGEVVGSLLLGPFADRFGRRPIFLATTVICFVFGMLTAAANTFGVLIFFRFMVGFAIGGLTVPFDCLAEFLPTAKRGRWLVTLNYSWQLGQLMIILFAYLTLGTSGDVSVNDAAHNRPWKIFTVLSALPGIISSVVSWVYVPESPRWLLSKGRPAEALKVLRGVAKTNKKDADELFPLEGQTILTEGLENEKGDARELFKPAWRKVSTLVATVWFINGFFYFSAMQLSTILSSSSDEDNNDDVTTTTYSLNYVPIVAAALFEALGQVYPTLFVDTMGRRPPQLICYAVAAIAMLLYGFLPTNMGQQAVVMLTRMAGTITYVAMSVQVSELLPTGLRGKGHSLASFCQRMGGFASPYLVDSLLDRPSVGGIVTALCVVAFGAVYLLPETNKRILGGVVEHIVVAAAGSESPEISVAKTSIGMEEGAKVEDEK